MASAASRRRAGRPAAQAPAGLGDSATIPDVGVAGEEDNAVARSASSQPQPDIRHGIGGNNPPRHILFAETLDDVHLEATSFLDGAAIETPGQADAIGKIIATAKAIKRDADAARTEDKAPHLAAGRQIDADYKPVETKADAIIKAASAPLTVWLNKLAEQQRERERIAREAAARLAQEAIAAERGAVGNLAAQEAVRLIQNAADAAAKDAAKAGKAKPLVAGLDRSIGLRTYRVVTVTDYRALINWLAKNDKPALCEFMDEYAKRATGGLPGVTIETERKVA